MAVGAAGIGEALPCFGDELPFVGAGFEGELRDTEGGGIAQFAVGLCLAEGPMILAAGADVHSAFAGGTPPPVFFAKGCGSA